jgi:hypothetical protein
MNKNTIACIIFLTFLCLSFANYAEGSSYPDKDITNPKKPKVHKVWITLINPSMKVEGYLYDCKDSSIVVSSIKEQLNDYSSQMIGNKEFLVSNIEKIKIRRKGSIGKGYLIGTGIGVGTGIALGATDGDGFVIFAVAGMLGIVGSVVGTTVGIITGQKNYVIHGNLAAYRIYASKLKASSIVID